MVPSADEQMLLDELNASEARDLVGKVAEFHAVRRSQADYAKANERMTARYRSYFISTGEREIWDGEHNIGVAFEDGHGARSIDFERLTDGQIVKAAKAGLLSLNAGAFDGALKSTDQRLRDAARALATQVYQQGGGYDPATGKGGQVSLLPKRGQE